MGLCLPSIKLISSMISKLFCDEVHIYVIDVFGVIPIQEMIGIFQCLDSPKSLGIYLAKTGRCALGIKSNEGGLDGEYR